MSVEHIPNFKNGSLVIYNVVFIIKFLAKELSELSLMNKDYFSEKNDLGIRFNLTMIIPTLNRPDVLYAQVKSLIRNFNRIKPKI